MQLNHASDTTNAFLRDRRSPILYYVNLHYITWSYRSLRMTKIPR